MRFESLHVDRALHALLKLSQMILIFFSPSPTHKEIKALYSVSNAFSCELLSMDDRAQAVSQGKKDENNCHKMSICAFGIKEDKKYFQS